MVLILNARVFLQARAGQSLSNYQELPLVPASPTAGRLSFGLAMQGQALSRTRYYVTSQLELHTVTLHCTVSSCGLTRAGRGAGRRAGRRAGRGAGWSCSDWTAQWRGWRVFWPHRHSRCSLLLFIIKSFLTRGPGKMKRILVFPFLSPYWGSRSAARYSLGWAATKISNKNEITS